MDHAIDAMHCAYLRGWIADRMGSQAGWDRGQDGTDAMHCVSTMIASL